MRINDRDHLDRTTKQIRRRSLRNGKPMTWKRARWLAQKGAGEAYGGVRIGCDLRCNGEKEFERRLAAPQS